MSEDGLHEALRVEHEHFTAELRRVEDSLREADIVQHERIVELLQRDIERDREASKVALAGVDRLGVLHSQAHDREHAAHETRHQDQAEALIKAEQSVDKRLESMNEFRDQLREQASRFVTSDAMGVLRSELDRRFTDILDQVLSKHEENRKRIEAIEKTDFKQEGKGLGQAATVAAILSAIAAIGSVLSIILVLGQLLGGG